MHRGRAWLLFPIVALLAACPKKKVDDDAPAENRPPAKHPCADTQSVECHAAHLDDPDASERRKAIDGLQANFDKVDLKDAKAVHAFAERAVPDLVSALTIDSPRPSTDDRRLMFSILAKCVDPRAKPAFLAAFKAYSPGVDDDVALEALRGISAQQSESTYRDDATATALTDLFGKARWTASSPKSIEVGERTGDLIAALGAKTAVKKLLEIVKLPNDGQDYGTSRETSMSQIVAARTLGKLGDASVVPDLVDAMYDHAARVVASTDYTTGQYITRASPLTTATSLAMATAVADLGGITAMLPFVKNDLSDAKVKSAQVHFYGYRDVNGRAAPTAYTDLPIDGLVLSTDPKLATTLEGMLGAAPAENQRALASMLINVANDKAAVDAFTKAADGLGSNNDARASLLSAAWIAMKPDLADTLLDVAKEKKNDASVRLAASTSAMFLATKEKIADVGPTFDKKSAKDPLLPALEATSNYCDPDTVPADQFNRCLLAPDSSYSYVMYNDVSPTYADELQIATDLVTSCDKGASCYFDALSAALKDLESKASKTTLDSAGAKAAVKARKAAVMFAAYASEDDAVKLAKVLPTLNGASSRFMVILTLDAALPSGSTKVADALESAVADARTKTSPNLPREESQLVPLAAKLRARAPSK